MWAANSNRMMDEYDTTTFQILRSAPLREDAINLLHLPMEQQVWQIQRDNLVTVWETASMTITPTQPRFYEDGERVTAFTRVSFGSSELLVTGSFEGAVNVWYPSSCRGSVSPSSLPSHCAIAWIRQISDDILWVCPQSEEQLPNVGPVWPIMEFRLQFDS